MKDHARRSPGWIAIISGLLAFSGQVTTADPPPRAAQAKSEAREPLRGRTEGIASPGSRLRLSLDRPATSGSRYVWVQTAGPPVAVDGQAGPELTLTVPIGAESLGFVLAVSDEQGVRTVAFSIPVVEPKVEPASVVNPSPEMLNVPKADAGDDAIGLVGRRVTLNGSESRPRVGLSYRWIQVDGPPVVGLDEAGRFCSFVPTSPGSYRFALVVAQENRISTADFVVVTVGSLPAPSALPLGSSEPLQGFGSQPVAPSMMPNLSAQAPLNPLDLAVSRALASLDDAPVVAPRLAEVFQAAALRMDLYRTYGEIFSELSRRLDAVVPAEPVRRGRWNSLLFEPLTAQTVAAMLPVGLDLRVAGSHETPLTNAQKQELRGLFERLARRLAPPRATH